MTIDAVEFVARYTEWLERLDYIIKPELYPAIRKCYTQDPHDLITPYAVFYSEEHAFGFVLMHLIRTHEQMTGKKVNAARLEASDAANL